MGVEQEGPELTAAPMLYGNDVCVPISALPEFVQACQKEMQEMDVYGPIVG